MGHKVNNKRTLAEGRVFIRIQPQVLILMLESTTKNIRLYIKLVLIVYIAWGLLRIKLTNYSKMRVSHPIFAPNTNFLIQNVPQYSSNGDKLKFVGFQTQNTNRACVSVYFPRTVRESYPGEAPKFLPHSSPCGLAIKIPKNAPDSRNDSEWSIFLICQYTKYFSNGSH